MHLAPFVVGFAAAAAPAPAEPHETERTAFTEMRGLVNPAALSPAIRQLLENDAAWSAFLSHLERGQRDWLVLAKILREAADAHAGESIDLAFASAIESAPRVVLSMFRGDEKRLCSDIDIDDPRWDTREKAMAALDSRAKVVRELVKVPEFVPSARACLDGIEEGRKSITRFFAPAATDKKP